MVASQAKDETARRVPEGFSWSARSTAIVALLLGVGIAIILVDHVGVHSRVSVDGFQKASLIVDSMALGIAVLSFAALGARNRTAPDRVNLITACMVGVLAVLVLPIDLVLGSTTSLATTSLVLSTRMCLVVLAAAVVFQPDDDRSARLRQGVGAVLVATVALTGLIGFGLWVLGVDHVVILRDALGVSAILIVLGALRVGALSLQAREPRGYVLALTLISIGVADGHATFIEHTSMSTTAGKAMRLVVVAAILVYTVIDLRDLAMRERDRATVAQDESDWAADRLIAQMAFQERFVHDSRNALLAIQGGLRSLADAPNPAMVAAVSSEVDRLRGLLEGDESDPLPVSFDLAQALEPMISCYVAAGRNISLTTTGSIIARGRPSIAAEVAQNLIENALAHGDGGEITVWIFDQADCAEVRVADRGRGVDVDLRDTIFEHGKSGGTGSGVGLHISRRLIELQGGSLDVSDRHGGGAIFSFRLPLAAEHRANGSIDAVAR